MFSNNSWTQLAKVWKLMFFFCASLDGDASRWQMFEAPGGGISSGEAGIKRLYHALSRNGWMSSDHYACLPMFSGKWSVDWFQVKLSYLEWSPPWHTILTISDIVSDISPGSIYGIYIYSDILSDILSGIYSDILSGILSGVYSDLLSGIYSGNLSGILSGMRSAASRACDSIGFGSMRAGPGVPSCIRSSQ